MNPPDIESDPGSRTAQYRATAHTSGSGANTSPMKQLFDTIRARLLDEFPGAEENKTKHYIGFRYPGGIHFCTIALQQSKIWLAYSGKHAALNLEPDGFVQRLRVSKTKYHSAIRNMDDFEKALSILKRLHAIWSSGDRTPPPGSTPAPYYSASTSYMDQLYDTIRARLLDEFPGAEETETDQYNGFRYPGGAYFCTFTIQKTKIWFSYSGRHAASNLKPDGFVQKIKRRSRAKYHSDIRNMDDFEKVLSVLKRLYSMESDGDRKRPPDAAHTALRRATSSYIDQLYDAIRARLLDEFPGSEETKTKHYIGFRYNDGIYFCTITKQKSKMWLGYSSKHAELNLEPDGFVQKIKRRSRDKYHSEIRNMNDFEKALSVLKRLHDIGSDGDRERPPGTAPAPYRSSSVSLTDQLYDTIRARLLDEFPGSEETKTKYYNGFRYPNGKYFCTVSVQKSNLWFSYSGKRAESKLKPDDFVQDVQRWSGDKYHSEIKNMDDFEKALSILKRLHDIGSDGDRKQPSGIAFDPDYTDSIMHLEQLYDTIRARLLDEFPGSEENKIEYYSGFRYPGDTYFCTVTKQKSKIRFVYSGQRAVSNLNPDEFIKVGKGWGAGIYYSDIRNGDDFEKALSILIQIYTGEPG